MITHRFCLCSRATLAFVSVPGGFAAVCHAGTERGEPSSSLLWPVGLWGGLGLALGVYGGGRASLSSLWLEAWQSVVCCTAGFLKKQRQADPLEYCATEWKQGQGASMGAELVSLDHLEPMFQAHKIKLTFQFANGIGMAAGTESSQIPEVRLGEQGWHFSCWKARVSLHLVIRRKSPADGSVCV